jgi:hypothetical protein
MRRGGYCGMWQVGEGSVKERFELKTSDAYGYFHKDVQLDQTFEKRVAKGKMDRKSADAAIRVSGPTSRTW